MEQTSNLEGQSSSVDTTSSSTVNTAPSEKLIPQSKVDEIVRHANARVADKVRKEMSETQSAPTNYPPSIDMETIRKVAAEEAQKQQAALLKHQNEEMVKQQGNRIANEFISKLEAAKQQYEDFDTVVGGGIPLGAIPNIVQISNSMENTAAVIYELQRNPLKATNLEMLASLNPALARDEMRKLAQSINLNEQAKSAKTPNEPLSQISPSPVGTDNGSLTLKDLKKASWLRG